MPVCQELTAPLAEAIAELEDVIDTLRRVRRSCNVPRGLRQEDRDNACDLMLLPNQCAIAIGHMMDALIQLPDGEELVRLVEKQGYFKR